MLEEFKNAFHRPNNAHVQLIIINVVIFGIMAALNVFSQIGGFESAYILLDRQFTIPAAFNEFLSRPWTLITYAFAHGGILHILFNMLWLYWFGRLFVEYLGSDKMVALYVLGAIAGGIFFLLAYNTIPYFMQRMPIGMVGASAAINAIVVGAATLLPNYAFYLMFIGPVKIKYLAGIVVFISFIETVGTNGGGNIAHLGGALIGFVYIKQLQAGINWGSWVTAVIDWVKGLFHSKPRVKVTYRKAEKAEHRQQQKPKSTPARASQDEIDAILDKISEKGYESLTRDEKEKLFNASKK